MDPNRTLCFFARLGRSSRDPQAAPALGALTTFAWNLNKFRFEQIYLNLENIGVVEILAIFTTAISLVFDVLEQESSR